MIGILLRVVALTGLYLLVVSSTKLGDIATGVVLASLVVAVGRRHRRTSAPTPAPTSTRATLRRLAGVPTLIGGTVVDVVTGSADVIRCCLGRPPDPGLVWLPTGPTSPSSFAAWGIRLGITPNTVVVEVDEERGAVLVHVLDAHDPETVRDEQMASYRSRQQRVFP
ncbi:Na+/H+ antiporter subunit E [Actinomycetospora callitridis]|uniref:Na+/H+ antiporter subunit E n=1 Tax=Actinomycetospora callitridis TaxID=913944 RepID=UPI0023671DE0|nr:Na+/H+ antiporter subunit E [Actinomycetospora callitridis]MDD7921459.1 Na+/H+ antiporter subunit E [Actinomycetospora callitridis]